VIENLTIHIGDPKCGSSSIQAAMKANACRCEGLTIVSQKETNASAMALSIRSEKDPKRIKVEFEKKAQWASENDADIGIISAEFFSQSPPEALVAALKDFMPEHAETTNIIAYARPHTGRILSGYGQCIKNGNFIGTAKEFLNRSKKRRGLFYKEKFDRWQAEFHQRFTLRPFIRDELFENDVVNDFFHTILGERQFTLQPVPVTNETMNITELSGMKLVQTVFIDTKVPQFLRLPLGSATGQLLSKSPNRSGDKLRIHKDLAKEIRETYLSDATELDASYFGKSLFKDALDASIDNAAPTEMPLEAREYFSSETIEELRSTALKVAELVNRRPHAWRRTHQIASGQLGEKEVDPLNGEQQNNANEVWSALGQIVQSLVSTKK